MKFLPVVILGMLLIGPGLASPASHPGPAPADSTQVLTVPEPAVAMLGALGVLTLLRRRRAR